MDVSINLTSEQILHDNRRRRILLRVLTVLAVVTVFCTVYALVLPAITEEAETFCGFEEHTHTEACYAQEQLICGLEEYEAHTHTEDCLAEVTELTCALEETEGHTHTEACFEEQPVLSCGLEETEGGEARMVLTCTETESEEHTHSDACYTEEPAVEPHTHSDACYTLQQVLICTQEECEAHTHTDACYTTSLQPACGLEEGEGHAHTEACYAPAEGEPALICELEEHSHSLQCYSNPEADVETAAVWSRSVASVQLTGDWRKDLVSIAGTQMGYAESSRNYLVENGDIFGYTRYGDWYGYPYGDWCAMFVSFCLNYSDIPATAFPRECGTRPWVEKLTAADMYVPAEGYVPTVGDLVFFDYDEDELSDHVGIVSAVKTAEDGSFTGIATIEGNAGDRVASLNYAAGDKTLLGYGILPENPALAAEEETEDAAQELELITKTATAGDYLVTASYTSEAGLPEEAVFEAYVIDPESEAFAARAVEYYEATGKTLEFLLNIGFYVDGVEVEPTGTVNITIRFLGEADYAGVDPAIVHFGESVTETLENTPVDENAETAFAMDSFTEIGGTLSADSDTPATASNVVASGTDDGGVITWTLTDDGVLTISGSGTMYRYSGASGYPWYSYKAQITAVVVEDGVKNIGKYAFSEYSNLQTVTLGKDVAAIELYAFQKCSALTTCSLSESLQLIDSAAFSNCTALSGLTMPETVKTIGPMAFFGCTKLTEVRVPDSVTSMGTYAFAYCYGLKSVELGSGITAVNEYTFQSCSALTEVSVPDGVTTIGKYAFSGCKVLSGIELPERLTTIGEYAFYNCAALTDVDVPEGVTAIGQYAFSGCTALTRATLRAGLTEVAPYTFYNCTALTDIELHEGITTIGNRAFYGCKALTAVELPEGLTTIGEYVFYNCSKLTDVTVPATLTKSGKGAFSGVNSAEVHISDLEAWLQIDFANEGSNPACGNTSYLYLNGELLTELVIPEGTTKVKQYAFYNDRAISSISLPEGLTEIGTYAFFGCQFSELTLPESLSTVGSCAFYQCTALEEVNLPDKLKALSVGVFSYCTALKQINLPAGLESIGSSAFAYCKSLTELTLPDGITSLESSVLANCTSLRQVTLPAGLTKIKSYAFENCTALKQITLPEGLKTVETAAFRGCTSMESLVVPDSVTSFAYDSCAKDSALAQLTLGAGISQIGYGVVDDNGIQTLTLRCANLTYAGANTAGGGKTVILDTTVKSINEKAWTGLTTAGYGNVIFRGPNVLSLPAMSFDNGGEIGGGTYYATEEGALYLLDAQTGTASLAYVPDELTEYTVPAAITAEGRAYTITGVESHALNGADDLTALTITNPEQLLSVAQGAFAGAEQLASINGCTTQAAVRELFTNENAVIGSNLTEGTRIGGVETALTEENRQTGTVTNKYNYSGDDEIRVNLAQLGESATNRKDVTEDGVFVYYTGYGDSLGITISNSANMTEETGTVIRAYISFDAPEGALTLAEGSHTVTAPDGSSVLPYTVVKVNDYLYYIEVKAEDTNHSTSEITFSLTYPNGSAGGDARVWTVIGNADALTESPADGATQYQQVRWVTEKIPYYIDKELSTAKLEFTAREDGSLTVKQFTYTITPKTESTRGTSYGMDVVTTIGYTDVFTLSDGLVWNPEYLEAIKAGRWYVSSDKTGTPRSVYVYQADDTPVKLFTLSDQTMDGLTRMGPQLEVVTGEDGKETVQITWEDLNSYAYSQDAAKRILTTKGRTYTLYVYDGAILVGDELSEALADKTYTVTNSVNTEWQYRYSDTVHSEDAAEVSLALSKYNITLKKKSGTVGSWFGENHTFKIYLENTGNLPYPYGNNVSDTLSTSLYIRPADMYKMLTDESWGSCLQITINNAYFETAVFTPQQVTLVDGTTSTTLTETQNSGYNTTYASGDETDWSATGDGVLFVSENSAYYSTGKLQLWWQDDILYLQKGEETPAVVADAADLQAQLNAMGFFVGASTQYRIVWTPRAEKGDTATFVVPGNTKYTFDIYATCKDTLMLLSQDHLRETSISSGYVVVYNTAYFYSTNGTTMSARLTDYYDRNTYARFNKEFYLKKAVTNAEGESTESVVDGDVIRYTVNLTNKAGQQYYSNHDYDLLPWTDRMVGAQLLLVPVTGNKALAGTSAEPYTAVDGTQYYKLLPAEGETEVTFRNVLVAGKVADTVMVARTASGYATLIKWYFSGEMAATTTLSYEALVDSSVVGEFDESTGYSLGNVTWLGDHQGHRIFDPVFISGHNMYHDKSIVTGTGANGEDVLEKYSIVYEGDEVTYRLDIRNLGKDVYTISSSSLYDALPLSLKGADWTYLWSRDNVTVRYGGNYENAEQSVISGGDSWYITEGEAAGNNGAWQQELRWGDDFLVRIPGGDSTFYIYVTLKYPVNSGTADYWSRYCEMNAGKDIINSFHIADMEDTVSHELGEATEVLLQKGVVSTSLVTESPDAEDAATALFYYENGGATVQDNLLQDTMLQTPIKAVTYYTAIYNDGNARLYLEPLEDIAPEGFICTSNSNLYYYARISSAAVADIVSASGKQVTYLTSSQAKVSGTRSKFDNSQPFHLYFTLTLDQDHYSAENEHY